MRFHKIEMVGKFVLQKVDSLPAFNFERDQGRLVYNLADNKVYQGSNAEWAITGAGDIPTGDIATDTPDAGKVIYYDGNLYYGDGSSWNVVGGGSGDTPTGDIATDTPDAGRVIYDDGNLYYGDGTQWNLIGSGSGDVSSNVNAYNEDKSISDTWVVTHNLGSYYNIVQCYNSTNAMIIPNSIIQNSINQLTITFETPVAGYVSVINTDVTTPTPPVVTEDGIYLNNSSLWNINHGFDTNFLMVDLWDTSGTYKEKIMSNNTIVNDSNNLSIDWDGVTVQGQCNIITVDNITGQYKNTLTSASQWNVNHSLNSNQIIVNCWDNSGYFIYPNYVEIVDNNNVLVDFGGVNTAGNVCITSTDIVDKNTYFNSFTSATSWVVDHNLDSQNIIVQVWSDNKVVIEYTATINTNNRITVDFDGISVNGNIMIIKVD